MPPEIEESVNTGVDESASSEPQESSNTGSNSEAASSSQENNSTNQQAKYVPYERFQELVEQKNQFARQISDLQRQFSESKNSQPAKAAEKDKLIEELRTLNPEFASRFEQLNAKASQVDQLTQWKTDFEAQQIRSQAVNMVNGWHTNNKVTPEMQDLYNAQLEFEINKNPNIKLQDLKGLYDSVHSKFNKIFETRERSKLESYVTDKKKDASIPSMPKSKAQNSTQKKTEWSNDPSEVRSQMVQRIRQHLRADKD